MWLLFQLTIIPISIAFISFKINSSDTISKADQFIGGQELVLVQLRELVDSILEYDYERTDDFLLPWLRECDMELNCTSTRIHKVKKWRKENHLDSILNETMYEMRSYKDSCSLETRDQNGYPVLICEINGIDFRRLVLGGHKESIIRHYFQWTEKLLSEHRKVFMKTGKLTKPILFVNADGYSIKQHSCFTCIDVGQEAIRLGIQYYPPELFQYVIVINLPTIALPVLRLFKPIFPVYYQNALKIFGTNKDEWSKFLLDLIPADYLSKEYGGTK